MRIEFLPASLARLVPSRPAVFMASDLARDILLTLTGPLTTTAPPSATTTVRALACVESSSTNSTKRPSSHCRCRNHATIGLQAIAQLLYENRADNTSLAEHGQTIGASARTLSRLFRNELGMTFCEWRTQLRIYHALVLLADGHACGWANPSSFIAAFTTIIGTAPGRHRTSHQRRTTPIT